MRKLNKIFIFPILLAVVLGVWGCSSDDTDVYPSPEITAFFNEALPGGGHLSECFFASATSQEKDTCCLVNSRSELQALYACDKKLPKIDFDKYTLILGTHIAPAGYKTEIKTVETTEEAIVVTLEMESLPVATSGKFVPYNYWGLYDKLYPRKILTKVIRIFPDIEDM